jgi:hypothetical protein
VGVTPKRQTGPVAVLLLLEGIDTDCLLPPDTAVRWERLLSGRGWTEVLIYRAGSPGAGRHADGVDRPQDDARYTD